MAAKGKIARRKGKAHKFTGRNDGPSRRRYRSDGRLMAHKVKHLMTHNGLTEADATVYWLATRRRSR